MHRLTLLLALILFPGVVPAQKAVPCVNHYVTYPGLTQHEFDALVDFTFNVGCGAFRKSTLLKKMNRGDIPGAAREFPKWTYIGRTQSRGLLKRRRDEMALFLKP